MDDTELERLLTQLLRVVSPAPGGEPPIPARVAGSIVAGVRAAAGDEADAGQQSEDQHGAARHGASQGRGTGNGARGRAGGGQASPGAQGAQGASGAGPAGAEPPAVSASEARALIELVSARGIAQGELAGLLGLEKSTVSRLAAGLERKGWIRRGRDEGNQRYVRLYLTQEGRAIATQVWGAWQSRQARILSALSPEERVGLSAGLRGLVRGLAAEGLLGDSAPASDDRSGGGQPRPDEHAGPGQHPDAG
ncbi:MAG TPA: MarR family winged helix-turn-helix transcriptional regulator [Streptosporangiaceae bacterium]|nr:MarR family winged helix-turn-helix transcriptional regulator [Streptosporangiaceae bacterium]